MSYDELWAAVRVLGLGERATLAEIKSRYRELVKRHHPDAGAEDPEPARRVIEAHRRIMRYIDAYRYGFSEQEYLVQDPEERLRRRFGNDSLWGKDRP